MKKSSATLLSTSLIIYLCASVPALSQTVHSQYKVWLHGLPLAYLNFKTEMKGDNYKIEGQANSSLLTNIVSEMSGKTMATGKIKPTRLEARTYSVNYTNEEQKKTLNVEFGKGGIVKKTRISPKPETPPSDWVSIKDEDLLSVIDPLSSLTLPFNSPACPRTISIFSGQMLFDLTLTRKGFRRFKIDGFSGNVVACGVKFQPKGGYRAEHESIKYLMRSDNMELWFAKNDRLQAYIPIFAKIPTRIGDVRIRATQISSE